MASSVGSTSGGSVVVVKAVRSSIVRPPRDVVQIEAGLDRLDEKHLAAGSSPVASARHGGLLAGLVGVNGDPQAFDAAERGKARNAAVIEERPDRRAAIVRKPQAERAFDALSDAEAGRHLLVW